MSDKFEKQRNWRRNNPVKRSIISAFAKARIRAQKRGVPFDIPRGTTKILFDRCGGKCEISGIPFRVTDTGVCSIYSPSLDRIRPEDGYVVGNIRLILHGINALKGEASDEDLYGICEGILNSKGK